jgi:hypothetical protein
MGGAPLRQEEVAELMYAMNQPEIAYTLPDEADRGDDPGKQSILSHFEPDSNAERQALSASPKLTPVLQ